MAIALFLVYSAFCAWVVFGTGAERLEGILAAIAFSWRAKDASPDEIKFYAAASWISALIALALHVL